jgi:hypothetical protein
MARRREGGSLRQAVIGRRDAQLAEIRKALEDRSHGIAGAVGNLRRGRHRRHGVFPQQGEIGLDDQLLRPLAAQAAAVDSGGLGGKRCGHGAIVAANAARGLDMNL